MNVFPGNKRVRLEDSEDDTNDKATKIMKKKKTSGFEEQIDLERGGINCQIQCFLLLSIMVYLLNYVNSL